MTTLGQFQTDNINQMITLMVIRYIEWQPLYTDAKLCVMLQQWIPLNGITLGQRQTDINNQLIIISK